MRDRGEPILKMTLRQLVLMLVAASFVGGIGGASSHVARVQAGSVDCRAE